MTTESPAPIQHPVGLSPAPGSAHHAPPPAAILILLTLALAGPLAAQSARSLVGAGNKAYDQEQFDAAMNSYESAEQLKPESPEIWFNKGDALYKKGEYAKAMEAYEQAAVLSGDPKLGAWSKYNQGNAAFRQGLEQAQQNPKEAIKGLERGVELYRDALGSNAELDDARHNIEVARRAIERLRLMEQQQQQQNQDDSKDKENQEQQDQQQQQQQSGDQNKEQEDQKQQQQQPGEDEENQEPQDQQQQQPQQQQQAGEEEQKQQQQAAQAKDILDEERENRQQRRLQTVVGMKPVDKDW